MSAIEGTSLLVIDPVTVDEVPEEQWRRPHALTVCLTALQMAGMWANFLGVFLSQGECIELHCDCTLTDPTQAS